MGTLDKQGVVTMQELLVSSLAQTDALTNTLIEKGLITEAEFMQMLGACRRNAKPSDSPDDFSHLGDDFRGLTDLRKRKSLEFRAAYPTF